MRFHIRKIRYLTVAFLALFLTFLPLMVMGGEHGGGHEAGKPGKPDPIPWTGPVPKAECGPNDRTESGLQGQTTLAERVSGLSELGFNCNLELVGEFNGEGAKYQMTWFDDCAYYGTLGSPAPSPLLQHHGVVVVDASDPRHPQASSYLDTPAMLDPHESLKVHEGRKLLAAVEKAGPGFAIYDVSADCRHPVLKGVINVPGTNSPVPGSHGHAGNFTPDGMTYYATQDFRAFGGIMPVIDVSDPSNPQWLLNWKFPGDGRPHDISFSEDGTRAYSAQPGQFGSTTFPGPNGLVILDVSDIQFRRPNPQIGVISTLFWIDGGQAQQTLPVKIKGRPYLIFTDETGAGGIGGRQGACMRDLPPFGFTRIIDISDESNPKIVAKLMLEVHDPANCPLIQNDILDPSFIYDSHYCGVDNAHNAKLLACSYFRAGVRVFNIRDPYHPREIAYYKAPAWRLAARPGSALFAAQPGDRTTNWSSSLIRFRKPKGEQEREDKGKLELWFTTHDGAFQIVRFTEHIKAIEKGLLGDD